MSFSTRQVRVLIRILYHPNWMSRHKKTASFLLAGYLYISYEYPTTPGPSPTVKPFSRTDSGVDAASSLASTMMKLQSFLYPSHMGQMSPAGLEVISTIFLLSFVGQ